MDRPATKEAIEKAFDEITKKACDEIGKLQDRVNQQQALIDELVEVLKEVEQGLEEAIPTTHSLNMRIKINGAITKATKG